MWGGGGKGPARDTWVNARTAPSQPATPTDPPYDAHRTAVTGRQYGVKPCPVAHRRQ